MTPTTGVPTAVTPGSAHGEAWRRRLAGVAPQDPLDGFGVGPGDALVVVVAHPDDETLAMGAAISRLARDGVHVHLVVASCGEAALNHLGVRVPGLAARRREELRAAAGILGVAALDLLGLPDGSLAEHGPAVRDAVGSAVHSCRARQVATLWREDPHPDHRAVGRVAARVAAAAGAGLTELGLWATHWTDPGGVAAEVVPLRSDPPSREAKRLATACYRSQTEPLLAGLGPVLPPAVLAFADEYVVRP